jgi:hypothetical protein
MVRLVLLKVVKLPGRKRIVLERFASCNHPGSILIEGSPLYMYRGRPNMFHRIVYMSNLGNSYTNPSIVFFPLMVIVVSVRLATVDGLRERSLLFRSQLVGEQKR